MGHGAALCLEECSSSDAVVAAGQEVGGHRQLLKLAQSELRWLHTPGEPPSWSLTPRVAAEISSVSHV